MLKPLMLAVLVTALPLAATAESITMLANTSPPYADSRLPDQGVD